MDSVKYFECVETTSLLKQCWLQVLTTPYSIHVTTDEEKTCELMMLDSYIHLNAVGFAHQTWDAALSFLGSWHEPWTFWLPKIISLPFVTGFMFEYNIKCSHMFLGVDLDALDGIVLPMFRSHCSKTSFLYTPRCFPSKGSLPRDWGTQKGALRWFETGCFFLNQVLKITRNP